MMTFRTVAITGCILATIAALAAASKHVPQGRKPLTVRPLNVAVPIGETAIMICEADNAPDITRVIWYEYFTVGTRQQISDNGVILTAHPNAARYSIIQPDNPNQFYLQVDAVSFADGGTYECVEANSGPPNNYIGRAELIVINPNTNCTSTVPSNGIVRETQNFTNECIISYSGGIAPSAEWIGPTPFNSIITVNPTTVYAGLAFTVQRDFDTRNYQLHINFTALDGAPDGTATNAPEYNRIDAFGQLFVYWAPINLYVTPLQPEYLPGDEITCYADARPTPVYAWQNLVDLSFITSQIFVVTENMVGLTVPLRCQAQNIIQGLVYSANYFINITVPAPTTPTTTTLVPPTTTPPLDGPCNDLSGWWMSASPYAEINLIVTPDGRVTGGMKNFTDPYTVEVAGRTRTSDYAYLGISLIYPNNKGIVGLSGECHRCSGVEILFVESLWRSITDSAFCGDGGTPAASTAYEFRRWDGGLSPGR